MFPWRWPFVQVVMSARFVTQNYICYYIYKYEMYQLVGWSVNY